MLARSSWGVASQVASSGSNFLVSLFLVRSLNLKQFAMFSLVFILVNLFVQILRSTTGQTLLLSAGSAADERGYLSSQFFIGIAATSVVAVVAYGTTSSPLTALLFCIATMTATVQDGLRYAFMNADRWRRVAISDLVWLFVTAASGLLLSANNMVSTDSILLAWMLGGLIGAITFGRHSVSIGWKASSTWLSSNKKSLLPLTGETGLFMAAGYAVNWIVALVAGLTTLGLYRASQVAMNPISTLGQSATVLLLRQGRRHLQNKRLLTRRQVLTLPILPIFALIAITAMWVLTLEIPGVGAFLFADNWKSVQLVLPLAALGQGFACVTLVATAWLKVLLGAQSAFVFRTLIFWVDPVVIGAFAHFSAPVGAVLGLAIAQFLVAFSSVVFYFMSTKTLGERNPEPISA
jgi:O-antigen/teichoic acid export membrane protein